MVYRRSQVYPVKLIWSMTITPWLWEARELSTLNPRVLHSTVKTSAMVSPCTRVTFVLLIIRHLQHAWHMLSMELMRTSCTSNKDADCAASWYAVLQPESYFTYTLFISSVDVRLDSNRKTMYVSLLNPQDAFSEGDSVDSARTAH